MATAAEMLHGKVINGWTVIGQLGTYVGMSGGNFSTGYQVTKEGKIAFLKAMDIQNAFVRGIGAMGEAINQYLFERDVLQFCSDARLSGIITLLESGQFDASPQANPMTTIYYLVFEWADGDIRRAIATGGDKASSWKLRVLHKSAVALVQLHSNDIAHQDLKPSNVLEFNAKSDFKLGDLGRCRTKRFVAPTDALDYPGDYSYAPPEYHYGEVPTSFVNGKIGSDAYLLGSLISFLYTGLGALPLTVFNLPQAYQPKAWQGTYRDVLPFLVRAHTDATEQLTNSLPSEARIRAELLEAYFRLCHPDPEQRGHPAARMQSGTPIGLDRYRSIFDRMSRQAEVYERIEAKKASNG
ncbi:protein kinase-like protein [Pseudoduganella lurida]|uniref:Protein kinase-like protein n=1 Tax=Pseudoduganella lurida TaxID=1036180 RepID=A0A562R5N1_9BURK|nr:hypothetical protein [Pseudoduganella lurida]TWI64375.1 protein kinase-like protein [Pseudoduganella lurida]